MIVNILSYKQAILLLHTPYPVFIFNPKYLKSKTYPMKHRLIIFAFLLFLIYFLSAKAFSQSAPGGGSECPTSYSFKRNNGNGWGVCNGDEQIRVTFSPMPSAGNIPLLTAIYYQGQPVSKVIFPVSGELVTHGQGYVSYCLRGSPHKNKGNPFGKISASIKVVLEFTYPDGMICRTDVVN